MIKPNVEYDPETLVYYLHLNQAEVTQTVAFNDAIMVDLAKDGVVVGIENLDPAHHSLQAVLDSYGLAEQYDQIEQLLAEKLPGSLLSAPWMSPSSQDFVANSLRAWAKLTPEQRQIPTSF